MYTINDEKHSKQFEIRKPEDLEEVSTPALVATYNELTGKNIKKFENRAKAQEKVWELIQEVAATPENVATGGSVGKREPIDASAIVRVCVRENPKRPGTKAYAVFDRYEDGQTVARHNKGLGIELSDIRWNLAKGYIRLEKAVAE